MRYIIVFFVCVSACIAQETIQNAEFGFTVQAPSQWEGTTENDWSDEVKNVLKKHYWSSKPLLILNPAGSETLSVPSIIITGIKLKKMTTSEAIAYMKRNGRDAMISTAENVAKYDVLGEELQQYQKEDASYDYDSSRKLATAIIDYQHKNRQNVYFTAATAKFVGLKRVVDFRGYWKGANPEEFQQVFKAVIDSFEYDDDAAAPVGSSFEGRNVSEKMLNQVIKWGGIILTISIILGIAKMIFAR